MWEYITTIIDIELLQDGDDYLNNTLGKQGWEAYSAFPRFPHSEQIVVMMKRKLR